MTPATIISNVRNRLGDSAEKRWTDTTLLLYVSLCQNDICMFTNFYRKETIIPLIDGIIRYSLPSDYLALNRLEYADQLFPVETRNNIDTNDAVCPCALKDNLAYNVLEIILCNPSEVSNLTTILDSKYGVVTDAEDGAILEDKFGVVSDVVDDIDEVVGAMRAVESSEEVENGLTVYYTAVPPILTSADMNKALILPDVWFQAFLHFVCGMALQDDNDANNIQRGEMEGSKYTRILANIQKTSAKDFTSNIRTKLTTNIRRV